MWNTSMRQRTNDWVTLSVNVLMIKQLRGMAGVIIELTSLFIANTLPVLVNYCWKEKV